jgi:hypothetical protein
MFSKISKVYNTTNPRLPLQTPVVKIVKEKNKAIKYTQKNKKSKLALIVPKIAREEKKLPETPLETTSPVPSRAISE